MSDIVERLRALAKAYPEDVFPPPPPGEHGETVDQCSAAMGRHFSSVFTEAADKIERLRKALLKSGELRANKLAYSQQTIRTLRERLEKAEARFRQLLKGHPGNPIVLNALSEIEESTLEMKENRTLREKLPEALEGAWERGYRDGRVFPARNWGDPIVQQWHIEALREIEEST